MRNINIDEDIYDYRRFNALSKNFFGLVDEFQEGGRWNSTRDGNGGRCHGTSRETKGMLRLSEKEGAVVVGDDGWRYVL